MIESILSLMSNTDMASHWLGLPEIWQKYDNTFRVLQDCINYTRTLKPI